MFDAICFRDAATTDSKIDIGFLAEALIFYGKVHFVGNQSGFIQLLERVGPYEILELVKRGALELHLSPDSIVVITQDRGTGRERHDFGYAKLAHADFRADLKAAFIAAAGGATTHGAAASELVGSVDIRAKNEVSLAPIRSAVESASFGNIVVDWFRRLVPSELVPPNATIRTWHLANCFQMGTALDLPAIGRALGTGEHTAVPFGRAEVLAHFTTAFEDAYYAANLSAEVASNYIASPLLQARFEQLWRATSSSEGQLATFQDFTLHNARAIREAVTSGGASFADLLEVLAKRQKFREWLDGKTRDADLAREYFDAVTRGSWVEKLPPKEFRWGVVTAAGVAFDQIAPGGSGVIAAVAISALDAFLLDRFLHGWRPDQFVNGPLKKLTVR